MSVFLDIFQRCKYKSRGLNVVKCYKVFLVSPTRPVLLANYSKRLRMLSDRVYIYMYMYVYLLKGKCFVLFYVFSGREYRWGKMV